MKHSSNEPVFSSKTAKSERRVMRVSASQTLSSNHSIEFDFETVHDVFKESNLQLGSHFKKQIRLIVIERFEKMMSNESRREKWSTATWVRNMRMEVVVKLMAIHRQKQLFTKAITLRTLRENQTEKEPISHFAILLTKILENAIFRRKTLFMANTINIVRRTDGFIQLFKSVLTVMRQRKSKAKKEAFKMLHQTRHLCQQIQMRFASFKIFNLRSCFDAFESLMIQNKVDKLTKTKRLLEVLFLLNNVNKAQKESKKFVFSIFKLLRASKQTINKTPLCSSRQRIYDQIQTSHRSETITSEDDRYYTSLFDNDAPSQRRTVTQLKNCHVISALGDSFEQWINNRLRYGFDKIKQKSLIKQSSVNHGNNKREKLSQTSQFSRVLLVVLGAVFTKQKNQAWVQLCQTNIKRSQIKHKIVYPKLTHLIKPVSPQRNNQKQISTVNTSLNFDKSFANYSSFVRKDTNMKRADSKVSLFKTEDDPYGIPKLRLNASQNEILVDRYLKHQAMRSISRTRTLQNLTSRSRHGDETSSLIAPWKSGLASPNLAAKVKTPDCNKTLTSWCLYKEAQNDCSQKKLRRTTETPSANILKPKTGVGQSHNQQQFKRAMNNPEPQFKNHRVLNQQYKWPTGRQANPMTRSYQKIEIAEFKAFK